jgi:hypothetical protein
MGLITKRFGRATVKRLAKRSRPKWQTRKLPRKRSPTSISPPARARACRPKRPNHSTPRCHAPRRPRSGPRFPRRRKSPASASLQRCPARHADVARRRKGVGTSMHTRWKSGNGACRQCETRMRRSANDMRWIYRHGKRHASATNRPSATKPMHSMRAFAPISTPCTDACRKRSGHWNGRARRCSLIRSTCRGDASGSMSICRRSKISRSAPGGFPRMGDESFWKTLSERAKREAYARHVHGIVLRVAGVTFAALPSMRACFVRGFSQRTDPATGLVRDDYLLAVGFDRAGFGCIGFTRLDLVDLSIRCRPPKPSSCGVARRPPESLPRSCPSSPARSKLDDGA